MHRCTSSLSKRHSRTKVYSTRMRGGTQHTQHTTHTTHCIQKSQHIQLNTHTQLTTHTPHNTNTSQHTQLTTHTTHYTHNPLHTHLTTHTPHSTHTSQHTHLTTHIVHDSQHASHIRTNIRKHLSRTGWQRCIGCLKLQVFFRKRATNYRDLLWKLTYNDKASYESSPPCTQLSSSRTRRLAKEIRFTIRITHAQQSQKASLSRTQMVSIYIHTYTDVYTYTYT